MQDINQKKPVIQVESPVMGIFCDSEFKQLTEKEKKYSYYFQKACWEGSKICYFQKSYESPAIFIILQLVFSGQTLSELRDSCLKSNISEADFQKILAYSCGFFNNCGNFLSFGDTKFIPDVSEDIFFQFIQASYNYKASSYNNIIQTLWNEVKTLMYNWEGKYKAIGFPPTEGISGYYSGNITKDEIQEADELLQTLEISGLNTRVVKFSDSEGYGILIASADLQCQKSKQLQQAHYYKNKKYTLIRGDFSPFLRRVSTNLEQALQYAANKEQQEMLIKYVQHFRNGDMELHKDSQRAWVKDKNPVIETNIGFIETYLDPKSNRAEWEGFVALVNKKQSLQTQNFVNQAPQFLKMMPWPSEFEKDVFLKPDFTSLSVLAFASSGVPLGINIPNYDDIRQTEGFKNVYLGNCVIPYKNILFLEEADANCIRNNFLQTVFHKVIFHELLGHGCGKLLQKTEDGYNFDFGKVINPVTGKPVESCYMEKDTWQSVFQGLSNPYEECRADSVALFFSTFELSYQVLQPEYAQNWQELAYSQFLDFVYQGINGLQFFNDKENKWGQAHINGRWVILQVLLEAGQNFIKIEKIVKQDNDWIKVTVDRNQVLTTGRKAMGDFLLKMNVFKATADYARAKEMFEKYSQVNDFYRQIRTIVINNKKPRRLEVQGHLSVSPQTSEILYEKFDESFAGIIQSYMKQFPFFDQDVLDLWNQYKTIMRPTL